MATYIPQVQDKVTSVRPPQTDWQFEAQLLSTRQAKYDAGHDKLSKMYGEILNSGLTREGNIEAREEFFKLIDSDLRKVAGIDLSLDSNVSQAKQVFNQIYENDYLVKDMVWTKNFQNEMQRAEGFRSCTDSDECGGEYWDDGVKYMQYKREEFKNSTNDESMGIQNTRYIPYNNMMAKAMEDMKEAEIDITMEETPDGSRYRAKMRNGDLAVSPLVGLFNGLYANNPNFQDTYKVLAYNERKDWTHNAVRSGEYETLEDAALGYVEIEGAKIKKDFEKFSKGIKYDTDSLSAKVDAYEKDANNGRKFTQDEVNDYDDARNLLVKSKELDSYLDLIKRAQKNQHSQSSMSQIGSILDQVNSTNLFRKDILQSAKTFSNKNKEITYEEDKGWLAQQQNSFDIASDYRDYELWEKKEEWKQEHGHSSYTSGTDVDETKRAVSMIVADQSKVAYDAINPGTEMMAILEGIDQSILTNTPGTITENSTYEEIEAFIEGMKKNADDWRGSAQDKYMDMRTAHAKIESTMVTSALKAFKEGNDPNNLKSKINWPNLSTSVIGVIPKDLQMYIPNKTVVQSNFFNSGEKKGRMYISDNGNVWTRGVKGTDGKESWYVLYKKNFGSWNKPEKWQTGTKTNKQGFKIFGSGNLTPAPENFVFTP